MHSVAALPPPCRQASSWCSMPASCECSQRAALRTLHAAECGQPQDMQHTRARPPGVECSRQKARTPARAPCLRMRSVMQRLAVIATVACLPAVSFCVTREAVAPHNARDPQLRLVSKLSNQVAVRSPVSWRSAFAHPSHACQAIAAASQRRSHSSQMVQAWPFPHKASASPPPSLSPPPAPSPPVAPYIPPTDEELQRSAFNNPAICVQELSPFVVMTVFAVLGWASSNKEVRLTPTGVALALGLRIGCCVSRSANKRRHRLDRCAPDAVCPNSLAKDDPKCQNGGRLHANNSTMEGEEYYANCAYCDCPPGWAGFDCSGTFLISSSVPVSRPACRPQTATGPCIWQSTCSYASQQSVIIDADGTPPMLLACCTALAWHSHHRELHAFAHRFGKHGNRGGRRCVTYMLPIARPYPAVTSEMQHLVTDGAAP